jgi:hypothetical protein
MSQLDGIERPFLGSFCLKNDITHSICECELYHLLRHFIWLWCKAPIHVTLIEMKTRDGAIILETELDLFKFKQFESEIILLTIRWYL